VRISVVIGLGFGDEGKGTIVDWLARLHATPPLVVRWNGGPQAAHHVVTSDGQTHCFSQLGSASFVDGARTHLAREMVVDLYALAVERRVFGRAVDITVDPRCVLVTPWHAVVNRVREARRGTARHGSTGRGIAEAKLAPDPLVAGDLGANFAAKLRALRARLLAQAEALAGDHAEAREFVEYGRDRALLDAFFDAATRPLAITTEPPAADHVILEGAQGALLDRDHGFFPHVTPSRITRRAAEAEARELGLSGRLEVWGVFRAYHTRHGEGPFPSEDIALAQRLPELHNREDGPAGRFRVGWFDAVLARYALACAGPIDRLAITCLDRVAALPEHAVVEAWNVEKLDTAGALAAVPRLRRVDAMASAITSILGRAIDVQSWGPTANDKRW
jgi:adenylosuccinate synthase